MHNLGFNTDCIFHSRLGIIEEKQAYTAIRYPDNPGYYWGNFLHFECAPTQGCFDTWIQYSEQEFGRSMGHISFAWDEQEQGDLAQFLSKGFELDEQIVLRLKSPQFDFPVNSQIEIQILQTEADWKALFDLQIEMYGQNEGPDFIQFKERAIAGVRKLAESKQGNWWGAFLNGKLVGGMGLFFDFDLKLGRFQSVETLPAFQNQGICKTLLKTVIQDAIKVRTVSDLVIVTEVNNHAAHVYRSCGFADHSKQIGVCLPRPYWNQ